MIAAVGSEIGGLHSICIEAARPRDSAAGCSRDHWRHWYREQSCELLQNLIDELPKLLAVTTAPGRQGARERWVKRALQGRPSVGILRFD
jgi:hypothetical protein